MKHDVTVTWNNSPPKISVAPDVLMFKNLCADFI